MKIKMSCSNIFKTCLLILMVIGVSSIYAGPTDKEKTEKVGRKDGEVHNDREPGKVKSQVVIPDPSTPLGRQYEELFTALANKKVDNIKSIAPFLIALFAAESQKLKIDIIGELKAKYNQAKKENKEYQLAVLASIIAEAHRHVATGSNNQSQKQRQDIFVAGSHWLCMAIGHIEKVEAPLDFRAYLVDRVPLLLSLHIWFLERISEPSKVIPLPVETLDKLKSLASVSSQPPAFKVGLSQYQNNVAIITANAAELKPIRKLIDDYVLAYNSKNTQDFKKLFDIALPIHELFKHKTVQQIIPPERWVIKKYEIKRIRVSKRKANIDLSMQYESREGIVAKKAEEGSFEARKGADNVWKLR